MVTACVSADVSSQQAGAAAIISARLVMEMVEERATAGHISTVLYIYVFREI